jgi:hypothetical protein
MDDIVKAIIDGKINTKEQAAALVAEEAAEMATFYGKPIEEARAILLSNIGYVTGYMSHAQADHVMELFDTEHPIFGKTHPSPEEALRKGMEMGEAAKKRSEEKRDADV